MEVPAKVQRLAEAEKLQWGHDKIVMEVHKARRDNAHSSRLQWGHDKIVMEVWALDV